MSEPNKTHAAGEGVSDEEMVETVAEQTDSASEHADVAGKDWDGDPESGSGRGAGQRQMPLKVCARVALCLAPVHGRTPSGIRVLIPVSGCLSWPVSSWEALSGTVHTVHTVMNFLLNLNITVLRRN